MAYEKELQLIREQRQKIAEYEQQYKQAREQIASFSPQILRTRSQLQQQTPNVAAKFKYLEFQRQKAKEEALQQLNQEEEEFRKQVEPIKQQLDVAEQQINEYNKQLAKLEKLEKSRMVTVEEARARRKYYETIQSLKKEGIKPIYDFKGQLKGFEGKGVSFMLPQKGETAEIPTPLIPAFQKAGLIEPQISQPQMPQKDINEIIGKITQKDISMPMLQPRRIAKSIEIQEPSGVLSAIEKGKGLYGVQQEIAKQQSYISTKLARGEPLTTLETAKTFGLSVISTPISAAIGLYETPKLLYSTITKPKETYSQVQLSLKQERENIGQQIRTNPISFIGSVVGNVLLFSSPKIFSGINKKLGYPKFSETILNLEENRFKGITSVKTSPFTWRSYVSVGGVRSNEIMPNLLQTEIRGITAERTKVLPTLKDKYRDYSYFLGTGLSKSEEMKLYKPVSVFEGIKVKREIPNSFIFGDIKVKKEIPNSFIFGDLGASVGLRISGNFSKIAKKGKGTLKLTDFTTEKYLGAGYGGLTDKKGFAVGGYADLNEIRNLQREKIRRVLSFFDVGGQEKETTSYLSFQKAVKKTPTKPFIEQAIKQNIQTSIKSLQKKPISQSPMLKGKSLFLASEASKTATSMSLFYGKGQYEKTEATSSWVMPLRGEIKQKSLTLQTPLLSSSENLFLMEKIGAVSKYSLLQQQRIFLLPKETAVAKPKATTRILEILKQKSLEILKQKSKQKERTTTKTTPILAEKTTAKPKLPLFLSISKKLNLFKKTKTNGKKTFTALTKRFGRWKKVAEGESLLDVFKKGKKAVTHTLARSLKILENEKPIKLQENFFFRKSKKEPNTLVQKERYSLSSWGEKKEIQSYRKENKNRRRIGLW